MIIKKLNDEYYFYQDYTSLSDWSGEFKFADTNLGIQMVVNETFTSVNVDGVDFALQSCTVKNIQASVTGNTVTIQRDGVGVYILRKDYRGFFEIEEQHDAGVDDIVFTLPNSYKTDYRIKMKDQTDLVFSNTVEFEAGLSARSNDTIRPIGCLTKYTDPGTTPFSEGLIWINVEDKKAFISVGTSGSSDWKQITS
jgi:hypothetical protein